MYPKPKPSISPLQARKHSIHVGEHKRSITVSDVPKVEIVENEFLSTKDFEISGSFGRKTTNASEILQFQIKLSDMNLGENQSKVYA